MQYAGLGVSEVTARLKTDILAGLGNEEARRRLKKRHEIGGHHGLQTVMAILWRQFANPLVYLLFAASIIANLIGSKTDATVILVILALNVIIGFLQEYKADRALKVLKATSAGHAKVIRGGSIIEIPATRVVAGDLIVLAPGDRAPADMRVAYSTGLAVDESQLTGESLPARKGSYVVKMPGSTERVQPNMLYWGSSVMEGHGRGIVTAVGQNVRFAQVLAEAESKDEGKSPLEKEMGRFARIVLLLTLVLLIIVFALSSVRGYDWRASVSLTVNLFVAVIPEGLPMIATLILVTAAVRMARQKSLVRRLSAAEMLGNIDVILTDKTGTLTLGQMKLRHVWLSGKFYRVPTAPTRENLTRARLPKGALENLVLAGAMSGDAELVHGLRGSRGIGDTVDVTLRLLAHKLDIEKKLKTWRKISELGFTSRRRLSATLARRKGTFIFTKGAPEEILRRARRIRTPGGERTLTQVKIDEYNSAYRQLAREGKRVLAVAERKVPASLRKIGDRDLNNLTILGLIGLDDAPREDAKETVESLRSAGIMVKMVTGDLPSTAHSIAREVGIAGRDSRVMTGEKISAAIGAAASGQINDPLKGYDVFARMMPEAKLELVRYYQKRGQRVAVTGDGVNDAAALKVADIGIALSGRGTDVAKETADLVLVDNNFATLVSALKEGRMVWLSFRKVIFFLAATNLAELMIILLTLALGYKVPFSPLQILWLNIVVDTVACQALAFEPSHYSLEERHSRELLPRWLIWRVVWAALWQTALVVGIYLWSIQNMEQGLAQTVAFTSLVLVQIYNLFNARSMSQSAFRRLGGNYWLLASAAAAGALTLASVYWRPLADFLSLDRLSPGTLASIALIGLSMVGFIEIDKLWYIRRMKNGGGHYG